VIIRKTVLVSGILSALTCASAALAQQIPVPIRPAYIYPAVQGPASRVAGATSVQVADTPLYFTPYLGLAGGYDDNLFYAPSNEKSSYLYVISPGLRFDARDASKVFSLEYQSQYGVYTSSRNDDYWDHNVLAAFDTIMAPSLYGHIDYLFVHGHDPRGLTDRPAQDHPDKYELSRPAVTLAYGAPGARGHLEAYYSYAYRKYINNRDTTIGSDRETPEYGAAFYWRVMPKTNVLIEARRTDQDYLLSTSPLDSTENRYYAGVTWEATAATTGTIKYGTLKKRFESDLPGYSGNSWEALVSWLPRTYSRFDFYSGRYPIESTGLGSFILSDATGVIWTHNWNSLLSTGLNARFQHDRYQNFSRNDDISSVGLHVGYKFRRWLTLGAEYTYMKRDSDLDQYDYTKNLFFVTATISM
jgi:hypothetical protein